MTALVLAVGFVAGALWRGWLTRHQRHAHVPRLLEPPKPRTDRDGLQFATDEELRHWYRRGSTERIPRARLHRLDRCEDWPRCRDRHAHDHFPG